MENKVIKRYKEFTFRMASIEDAKDIIELFERNYKKPMGPTESYNHFNWEYINNPISKLYILLAISDKNYVAAQYALLPKFLSIFGKKEVCTLSQDTVTDEGYRGKGLFASLASKLYDIVKSDKVLFTYGFPNKNSAHGFFNKLLWVELRPIPIFFKPLFIKSFDYRAFPYVGKNLILRTLYKFISYSHNRIFIKIGLDNDVEIKEVNDFLTVFDEIWANTKHDDQIIVIRDNKYIKWRYFDKPENNYRKFIFYKNLKPVGYLITSVVNKFGIDILFVVDFVVTSKELISILLSYIDNIAVNSNTPLISIMLPSIYRRQFLLSGYLRLPERFFPQDIHFGFRIHNSFDGEAKLSNINNWYLTWGDTDVV